MRKYLYIIITLTFILNLSAQQNSLPNITLKSIDNKEFNIKNLEKEPLVILSFWATWCSNCIYELDEIKDIYPEWKNVTGVKFITISIDDYRTISRVKPFLKSHQWPYEVLLDTNQKLKRTLNVTNIPYTVILKKGEIIYRHTGYSPGNEDVIFDVLKKASSIPKS